MTGNKNKTCEQRVDRELEERLDDLKCIWRAYCNGRDELRDLGSIHDYGLCFDYVPTETFDDQREAYFRYQLSWGGPSDEFRFYVNPDLTCHRIEYWFLDWFDGAHRRLEGDAQSLLLELWDWFRELGLAETAMDEAAL